MKIGTVLRKGGETNLDRYYDAVHVHARPAASQPVPSKAKAAKFSRQTESPEWLEEGKGEAQEMDGLNWDQWEESRV